MLYPANYDIRLLQNSTWRGSFRATHAAKPVTTMSVASGVPTFTSECHGLQAGDKVILTAAGSLPCGLDANEIYYVISAGLTSSAFRVSATSGGSAIALTEKPDGNYSVAYTASKPVNLTGYTLDSDIRDTSSLVQIATFTISVGSPLDGSFEMSLTADTTAGLAVGMYGYDLYMTAPGGERYYYLSGSVMVERTLSRA
jgi:hypothetical protein